MTPKPLPRHLRDTTGEDAELARILTEQGYDPATIRFPVPPVCTSRWTPEAWADFVVYAQPKVPPRVGKRYRLRNGFTTSPFRKEKNMTNYVYAAIVVEPGLEGDSDLAWLPSGAYITDHIPNRYDVVAEITDITP